MKANLYDCGDRGSGKAKKGRWARLHRRLELAADAVPANRAERRALAKRAPAKRKGMSDELRNQG